MKQCKNCHEEVSISSNFCPKCGTEVKGKQTQYIITVLVSLVVVLGGLIFYLIDFRSNEQVNNEVNTKMEENEILTPTETIPIKKNDKTDDNSIDDTMTGETYDKALPIGEVGFIDPHETWVMGVEEVKDNQGRPYLFVHMKVRNTDESMDYSIFPTLYFTLRTSDGSEQFASEADLSEYGVVESIVCIAYEEYDMVVPFAMKDFTLKDIENLRLHGSDLTGESPHYFRLK